MSAVFNHANTGIAATAGDYEATIFVIPYSITAISALLVYDYICTLEQEVEFIWGAPFSIGTILFALNRYLPFVDTFMSLHLLTGSDSPRTCLREFKTLSWLIVLGSMIAEVILMLRTYIIWERKRSILYTLFTIMIFTFIPAAVVTYYELQSLEYGPSTVPGLQGCFLYRASKIIYIAYIMLILCESVIIVLTLVKAVQHLRRSRTSWVVKLYQDGFLFYAYVLAISVVNIVIPVAAPPTYANWMATPQRVLHSIFCGRVLFFIFRQRSYRRSTERGSSLMFSSILSTVLSWTKPIQTDVGYIQEMEPITSD